MRAYDNPGDIDGFMTREFAVEMIKAKALLSIADSLVTLTEQIDMMREDSDES
jgi:hypothetical protein